MPAKRCRSPGSYVERERMTDYFDSVIHNIGLDGNLAHFPADTFPTLNPVHWLKSHFAVGGVSPLQRLSGMLTAHMTQIAPHNGFRWHPHRGLEIYTYVTDGVLYHEDTTGGKGTITAGEVQRMFSGEYIEHQELNRTNQFTRVIQIWFVADLQYRGMVPHYQKLRLAEMPARSIGEGEVREIIGPSGATDSHVRARLTSTIVPAQGGTEIELPDQGEDLFLYVVNGSGKLNGAGLSRDLNTYDVILARPDAPAPTLRAGPRQLNFLSFYLPSFWPVVD